MSANIWAQQTECNSSEAVSNERAENRKEKPMKYSEYKKLTPEQKQEAFESYLSAWLEAHNN
nr:MAG TPA: hypothetical protein [Ackermannviridae sp.]